MFSDVKVSSVPCSQITEAGDLVLLDPMRLWRTALRSQKETRTEIRLAHATCVPSSFLLLRGGKPHKHGHKTGRAPTNGHLSRQKNSLKIKFLGSIVPGHQEPRRRNIPGQKLDARLPFLLFETTGRDVPRFGLGRPTIWVVTWGS